jgi:hypothetical protein
MRRVVSVWEIDRAAGLAAENPERFPVVHWNARSFGHAGSRTRCSTVPRPRELSCWLSFSLVAIQQSGTGAHNHRLGATRYQVTRLDPMRPSKVVLNVLIATALSCQTVAHANDDMRPRDGNRWWRGEVKEEFWDGPCEVKIESKRGEFKREIKCKDGIGAQWRGEWKTEFRDGPCLVKQEAKRDEFKEEVKCEPRK